MKHFKVSSFPSLSYTTLEAKKKKNHKKKKFTTTTKKNTVIISEINWVSQQGKIDKKILEKANEKDCLVDPAIGEVI